MQSQNMDDYSRETETETTTNGESLSNITENEENEVIPLKSEELDVNKRVVVDEKVIIKKPVKETKTIEVQLNREEIESIERRPPSIESEGEAQYPIQSPEEIKIPLRREEAQVTKKPYVKEEVVVKKKTVTDRKEITEEVTSEVLDNSNIDKEV